MPHRILTLLLRKLSGHSEQGDNRRQADFSNRFLRIHEAEKHAAVGWADGNGDLIRRG
jgi:hypothetical protein